MKHKFLLASLMLFFSLSISAQSGTCGDNLTWTFNIETGVLTISGTGAMTNYTSDIYVPWYNMSITSVIISEGVTSIGNLAFYNDVWSSLTSIEIPNSVTSIGEGAFSHCYSLTSIEIPNSVTSIGNSAFYGCRGLTSVVIPYGVTTIGEYTFYDCDGLTYATIPNTVTNIGFMAFKGCSSMTSIEIPNSVTTIGDRAFNSCNSLTSVTIGNSVTSIGQYAFSGCKSLTSIEIPNNTTTIGEGAFAGCVSLTSIVIPNGVTIIEGHAFYGCSDLTSIDIPDGVTSIGERAFADCKNLTSIEIPNSATTIGEGAFAGCVSLTSIVIPNGVTIIEGHAFYGCSNLTSIDIPNGVTSIGEGAFYDCDGLTSLVIPNSVTSIGKYAFYDCDGLTSVTIGNNVISIGHYAFFDCCSLTSIICKSATPPILGINVFYPVGNPIPLYVYEETIDIFKATYQWKDFKIQSIPSENEGATIVWKNDDNSVLEIDIVVPYGTMPEYNGATPTKPADEEHTYAFIGWSPRLQTVEGDATYTAIYIVIQKDIRTTIDMIQCGNIVQGFYDFDLIKERYIDGYPANVWGWKQYGVYNNSRIKHITDPSVTDLHIGINAIPDNHSSSIRLATQQYNSGCDEYCWEQTAAGGRIGYEFTVTEQNAIAILDYAAMLEYPQSHSIPAYGNYWKYYQPWVQIFFSVVDDNDNETPYEPSRIIHAHTAPEGLNGWQPATIENGWEQLNDVPLNDIRNMLLLKKDWSSVGFDLRAVIGKKVCVWCEYYDCAISMMDFYSDPEICHDHHFARLYSALSCTQAILQKEEDICGQMASVTYSAPEGFTYRWYTAANPDITISTDRLCTYRFAYVGEQTTLYCEMQSTASMSPTTISVNIAASQCKYPLVIEADGHGTVTKIPDQEIYEAGTEITFIPKSDEKPICFKGWEGPDARDIRNNEDGTYTFTMPAHDTYLTAEFRACTIYEQVDTYICENKLPYYWEEANIVFHEGGYQEHVFHTASGADSIVSLHLNVVPSYNMCVSAIIWSSELPFIWEGETFNEAGILTKTLQSVHGCDSTVTFSLTVLPSDIVLQENEDEAYYTQFAKDYNGYTVTTATLNRQFTQGKWATLCLPFNVSKGMMISIGLNSRVYEFRYAETEGSMITIYFAAAQSIVAGKGYIVNANAKLAQKTSFVFPNVTINTTAANKDITALTGYNDNSGRGSIYLVGTLRTGKLQGTTNGNIYLGLKDNMLYYPNTVTGTSIRAYRGFFRSEVPLNAQRIRIVAEGETVTELQITGDGEWRMDDGQLQDYETPVRKYISNGILYIERNGIRYTAQGQRLD